jgi:DNA processing protein
VIKEVLAKFSDATEALAVMSGLGFCYKDWPCIKKIGATNLLASDLMCRLVEEKIKTYKYLEPILGSMRSWLDDFYDGGGYLVSPFSHPSSRLFRAQGAPLVFYGRFNQQLLDRTPAIAIVGSRNASQNAIRLTEKLTNILAERGVPVISGGARGIDQAAHETVLGHGGTTIMVLGIPCDKTAYHLPLKLVDEERIAIIYPFGPLTPTGKFMFVERNRYVAALADALVIMEGQEGSGTLHTARFAYEMKIPIYALPGAITDPRSYVANHLLHHQKATALVDFAHFVSKFTAIDGSHTKRAVRVQQDSKPKRKRDLPYLLQLIEDNHRALTFDELIALTGKPFLELQKELLEYELAGQITKQASQFVLTGN